MTSMSPHISSVCTLCNLLCEQRGPCHILDSLSTSERFELPASKATYRINNGEVTQQEAFERAGQLLASAQQPLVYGLTNHGTAVHREAIALADHLRCIIDIELTAASRTALARKQQYGTLTATLGEIRQRADLLLLLNCDPQESHPRLLERILAGETAPPAIQFLGASTPNAGSCAQIEGVRVSAATMPVDEQLRLWRWLRRRVSEPSSARTSSAPNANEIWQDLADRIDHSRYCAVIWQPAEANKSLLELHTSEFLRWLAAQNRQATIVELELSERHATTAEHVMTWQTGFPCSVSFLTGAPDYDPHRWIGEPLLHEREVDAALLIGCDDPNLVSESAATLPPLIALDCHPQIAAQAQVAIQTAAGQASPDTYFRLDGLALESRHLSAAASGSAATAIQSISELCRAKLTT